MINTTQLLDIFNAKLATTKSFDDAFRKAVWVAYQQGVSDKNKADSELSESDNKREAN